MQTRLNDRAAPSGKAGIESLYELSPTQEGLLFHTLYAPGSGIYVVQSTCRFDSTLDIDTLKQVWSEVIARHTILRTSFHWQDLDKPLQVVHSAVEMSIELHEWQQQNQQQNDIRLAQFLDVDRSRGFDLEAAPVMRLSLIKLGSSGFEMVWSHHHILLDGWSSSIVFKEVQALYEGKKRGEAVELEQRRPYEDYIAWLQRQSLPDAKQYWRKRLMNYTDPVNIAGGDRRDWKSGEYYIQKTVLDSDDMIRLQQVCRQQKVTMGTVAQACWGLLLSRYSGKNDVVFGAVVAGRPAELTGSSSMVGLFINTLPMRVEVRDDQSIGEWLRGIQTHQAQMRRYEHTPLVEVEKCSEIRRGEKLFDTILAFQNYASPRAAGEEKLNGGMGGGESNPEQEQQAHRISRTNYTLNVIITPFAGLCIEIIYDSGKHTYEQIRRMLNHYKKIVQEVASGRRELLGEIDILSEQEKKQLIFDWNQTSSAFSSHLCIHHFFQLQAALSPDSISAAFGHHQLSFAQLDRRSNQMAAYLSALGAGPEQKVGICLQSGLDMICWLVGILKSGAAYVPLDASYPRQRLAFIMKDSEVKLVVTSAFHSDRLVPEQSMAQPCDPQIIEIERAEQALNSYSEEAIDSGVSATNLAYVIYTSGSTGRPKGVEVEHRSVVNLLTGMKLVTGFSESDRLMSVTRLSFDIAGLEIYLPMMSGGRLEIASREEVQDGRALIEQMRRRQATVMQATPAGWRMVLESGWEGDERLRMLVGGEAVTSEQARRMKEKGGRVWNVYGPTETTIWSTKYEVEGGMEEVSIGRPIANTRVYIVDGKREIVGQGVEGEMEIGGEGVARGYRGRAEETAERYVPEMWSEEGGRRVYRTGDRCRYREGGEIEYLGRKDEQMKVRGYRVEAGEIEEALKEGKGVREAVVVKKERRGEGEEEIVGYVEGGEGESEQEMRERVRRKLPEYMVPRRVVKMERLPLTANGKVDRQALRQMREDDLDLQPETLFVAPRSPLEQQLANIWADVLGVRQVGVNDNFFDLGGHSLLALRVVCRLRDAIGADIPLRVLAEKPTVAEIASALEAEADKQGELQKETPLVVINGNGSKLPIFAVHPIGGTTFCYRELARHMGSDQPFYGLQAAGLDSPNLERKRIEEMASEYIEAIKSVRAEGPYLLMGWSYGGVVAFEMGQQLIRQGEKLVLTVVLDAPVPGEMGEAFSKDEGVVATLLARELARQKGVEINLKVEDVIGKQGDEQLRIVAEELSRSNVAPKDVGVEHIKRVLAGYEKRAAALMQYEAKVYAGELGVIRAKHKDEEMMKMLGQAQLNLVKDETYGWKKVCEKEVYSQEVGGHHETMLLEPQVRELAQKLNGMIEQAIEKWRREESLRSML